MIVQRRGHSLRLIDQNDHAFISGELARFWIGLGVPASVGLDTHMAIALHDASWMPSDAEPMRRPDGSAPYDFQSLPLEAKKRLYRQGIDRLEAVYPYAALLVSIHYQAFIPKTELPYHEHEHGRQQRLRAEWRLRFPGERVDRDYALLRLLDILSLRICMTQPGSYPEDWPAWVLQTTWMRRPVHTHWEREDLVVDPYPFASELDLVVPYRDVPVHHYKLDPQAVQSARRQHLTVRVRAA